MQGLKNIDEVAGLLGISPWTVRAYIRDGKLVPVRIGRRVLMEETELERFIARSKSGIDIVQSKAGPSSEKWYEQN
ncbi:MAG TPA: helix-turn-helix domain-containing protein [Terriglobales bacterium]|nr:helix-turn-helix domain-containing protein [Terriglobales bacterium]